MVAAGLIDTPNPTPLANISGHQHATYRLYYHTYHIPIFRIVNSEMGGEWSARNPGLDRLYNFPV